MGNRHSDGVIPLNSDTDPKTDNHTGIPGSRLSAERMALPVGRSHLWLCGLICLAWVVATVWILRGGFKHFEVDVYLPYHLFRSPLISKLFDSRILDADYYSSRELSFLFNHWDCQVIAACVRLGYPHFMSATMFFFVIFLALIVWRFCMRDLRLGLPITSAFTLLYLTTPFFMFSGWYFRTGKMGVALVSVLAVIAMYRFYHRRSTRSRWHDGLVCLWLFFLSSMAMLFDRQGVFFTCIAILAVVVLALRTSGFSLLLIPFILAIANNMFFNRFIATHVTWALHGYSPNFNFQTIPLHHVLERPLLFLLAGCGITLETMSFSFGNLPHVYFVVGWIGVAWLLRDQGRRASSRGFGLLAQARQYSPLLLLLGVTVSITLLNILMVCMHTPLVWPDVRRMYYWLPSVALWFTLATLLIHTLHHQALVPRRVLTVALFLLVAGNINALPEHRAIIRDGHLKKEIAFAPRLIAALRPSVSSPESVAPDIASDVIYQLFVRGYNRFDLPDVPLSAIEDDDWRVEMLVFETNRLQYAFVPIDGVSCAARGALITASPSYVKRSGLLGPMRVTTPDGATYGFLPRPLRQPNGGVCFTRIRVVNKNSMRRLFQLGRFQLRSGDSRLTLLAVGADKWLFDKSREADRQGAENVTIPISGNQTQELVYAFAYDESMRKIEMHLSQ
jgi:hypothetical protein